MKIMELKPNSITITYLAKVSFAALNGADKEVDNINPIKKITLANGSQLPYVSSQTVRRSLRDRLEEMGWNISQIVDGEVPSTSLNPSKYIDDDIFGYMKASKGSDDEAGTASVRTSPIRVESLVALSEYKQDYDYLINSLGNKLGKLGGNIVENEIHSGFYRGTILIELDRIGCEFERDKAKKLVYDEKGKVKSKNFEGITQKEKATRVKAFLDAFRTLWNPYRQTRYLADISPKFIAAGLMNVKSPIFLESVRTDENGIINTQILDSVKNDYEKFISKHLFAAQKTIFPELFKEEESVAIKNLGEGFTEIENWINEYYGIENKQNPSKK
jgi:CRISPR-associated protein Cst2